MAVVSNIVAKLKIDNTQFNKGVEQSKAKVSGFGSSLKAIGGIMAGAFSVRFVTQFAKASMEAYDVQVKSETKLLAALKGRVSVQQRLIALAQRLQKVTLFGDEQTIAAEAMLAKLGLNEQAITRLIPLVQDLATIQGMDLVSAADLVAKSVGSSTNALSRYGITIEGAVGSAERLESAVRSLNEQVGGQAQAAAKVGTGAVKQLSNAWGDFMEQIGKSETGPISDIARGLMKVVGLLSDGMAIMGKDTDHFINKLHLVSKAYADISEVNKDIEKYSNQIADIYEAQRLTGQAISEDEKQRLDILYKRLSALVKISVEMQKQQEPQQTRKYISPVGTMQSAGAKLYKEQPTAIPGAGGYTTQLVQTNEQLRAMGENLVLVATNARIAQGGIDGMSSANEKLIITAQDLNNMLGQVIQEGIQGLADIVISAFAGGDILQLLGNFLSNMGKLLVSFGAAVVAYAIAAKAMTNPVTALPAGIALIAAGVALGAIGGAISKAASGGSGGGGGYSTGYAYSAATPQRARTNYFASGNNEIILRARGSDLIGVLNTETLKRTING